MHSVLECVGTGDAALTAVEIARPGGAVARVGVPHYEAIPSAQPSFYKNVTIASLDEVPDGYRAMNDREAIKVMVNPS